MNFFDKLAAIISSCIFEAADCCLLDWCVGDGEPETFDALLEFTCCLPLGQTAGEPPMLHVTLTCATGKLMVFFEPPYTSALFSMRLDTGAV